MLAEGNRLPQNHGSKVNMTSSGKHLTQFARDCECADSVAQSNCPSQSDAAEIELPGPPVAILHQQAHGPAPPCTAPALANSEQGIARRLPETLTQRERAYVLSGHSHQGARHPNHSLQEIQAGEVLVVLGNVRTALKKLTRPTLLREQAWPDE